MFLDKVARPHQDEVNLLVLLPLERAKTVVFAVTKIVSVHVELGASHQQGELHLGITTLLVDTLVEAMQRLLQVLF